MNNKFIEDFYNMSKLQNVGKLEYKNFCLATVKDKKGNVMEIFNIFEDIIVHINNQKVGTYTLMMVRGTKQWILK